MQANVMYTLPSFRVHTETLDHDIGAFRDCCGLKAICVWVLWSSVVVYVCRLCLCTRSSSFRVHTETLDHPIGAFRGLFWWKALCVWVVWSKVWDQQPPSIGFNWRAGLVCFLTPTETHKQSNAHTNAHNNSEMHGHYKWSRVAYLYADFRSSLFTASTASS
jgi:hypothetical protein